VPGWFFDDAAIEKFLIIQFPGIVRAAARECTDPARCLCSTCRDLRGALLWDHVIRRLRLNESAEEIARGWSPSESKPKKKVRTIKPDVTNEDPRYWEEILASHGLSDSLSDDHNVDDDAVALNGKLEPVPFACPNGPPITASYVRRILQQIRLVAAGLRTDGKPRKEKRHE
jgi:hypothetical protein